MALRNSLQKMSDDSDDWSADDDSDDDYKGSAPKKLKVADGKGVATKVLSPNQHLRLPHYPPRTLVADLLLFLPRTSCSCTSINYAIPPSDTTALLQFKYVRPMCSHPNPEC